MANLDGGDRYLGHGDHDTETVQSAADAGMWVSKTGDGTVDLADVAGAGPLMGVVADNADAGETGKTVHYRGIVKVRVDSAVLAGDELATPDSSATTPGTPGVAEAGGSSGLFALRDAWGEDPDGDGTTEYFTYALLR